MNQIVSSGYASSNLKIPFMGVYSACATSVEGLIIGANMIEARQIKTGINFPAFLNRIINRKPAPARQMPASADLIPIKFNTIRVNANENPIIAKILFIAFYFSASTGSITKL